MYASGDEAADSRDFRNVSYDYGTDDKQSGSYNPLMFNGDPETFSWWKSKMYSHIIGIAEELRDIIENGVDLTLDEEGVVVDKKKHIVAQKTLYKKHHKVRGLIVAALPQW